MQHQSILRNITTMFCMDFCASFEKGYYKIKDYEIE
jgi:hypothetical protein